MESLLPDGWERPSGYSHGVKSTGETIFVAGQIGRDEKGHFASDALPDQVEAALRNIVEILRSGGAGPEHLARLTWYVTNIDEYRANLAEIGVAYRRVVGAHYPAMSLFAVAALVEPQAKVEIEATAVVPPKAR